MTDHEGGRPCDVEVLSVCGKIRCVPTSDRGERWFFGVCPRELREYFFYRAYADTPFGWFEQEPDDEYQRLVDLMQDAGLRVGADGAVFPRRPRRVAMPVPDATP